MPIREATGENTFEDLLLASGLALLDPQVARAVRIVAGETTDRSAVATAIEPDEIMFSPESYRLEIPTLDGYRAANCALRFSGAGKLDRTSADDVEVMRAAKLGEPIRLIVVGEVATKAFSLKKDTGELEYSFVVRITAVEAAETA
jgi:hypothetical protein